MYSNSISIELEGLAENVAFARVASAAFASQLDPTLEEISDIKTAVSEAVTNCIIHGYECSKDNIIGKIYIKMRIVDNIFYIEIKDKGKGIEDIKKAMEPMYTTKLEAEHAGMGFSFMEAFMDELIVDSVKEKGTTVKMKKRIKKDDTEI